MSFTWFNILRKVGGGITTSSPASLYHVRYSPPKEEEEE